MTSNASTMSGPQRSAGVGREPKKVSDKTYSGRLAIRIRELREAKGLDVRTVAKALKVYPLTIYRWEDGTREMSNDYLPALAKVLGVSVRELMPEK